MNRTPSRTLGRGRARPLTQPPPPIASPRWPFEDLAFAPSTHHRSLRTGLPEVIFAEGQGTRTNRRNIRPAWPRPASDVLSHPRHPRGLCVRKSTEPPAAEYPSFAPRAITLRASSPPEPPGRVAILTAGTAISPSPRRLQITANSSAAPVTRLYDVRRSRLPRLLASANSWPTRLSHRLRRQWRVRCPRPSAAWSVFPSSRFPHRPATEPASRAPPRSSHAHSCLQRHRRQYRQCFGAAYQRPP